MDNLFTKISKLLRPSTRIVLYSSLTQNLIGVEDVILWNETPLSIDTNTYAQFKEALKKRGCRFYELSQVLPYHDFCIALLCCSDYSLNHKVTPSISSRTYTSAWRSMAVIASTNDNISEWLNKFRNERSNSGYTNALNIVLDNAIVAISTPSSNTVSPKLTIDEEIVAEACNSNSIVYIDYVGSNSSILPVHKTSSTPEGQLFDLRVVHGIMNDRF